MTVIRSAFRSLLLLNSTWVFASETKVQLKGDSEVPAVKTSATGTGTVTVGEDKSISGRLTTEGVDGIAAHVHQAPAGKNGAHVHQAPAGKNGPPIVALEKAADGSWNIPKGSKLTDAQYSAYKAGELYVNVHSAANKSGEIRGQLKP
jgi:hypothetical protein